MKTSKERTESILEKAEAQRKKRKRIKLISILSGVAAAIIAFNLVLFVPYTVGGANISDYRSSEYYGVIQKLYGLTYSPRTTNNFNEWFGDLFKAGAAAPGDMPTMGAAGEVTGYEVTGYRETTLNQTDGVIEGDLFKRSDAHIFYLGFTYPQYNVIENCTEDVSSQIVEHRQACYTLHVYNIAGEDSQKTAEYKITPEDGTSFSGYTSEREMYLSEDLSTITVISPCYDYDTQVLYTAVINVDVSDLSDIKETSRTYVSGRYVSSRVIDDNILIISSFNVRDNVDFDNLSLYVPHVGKRGQMKPLLANDIVCPSDADSPRYTVICSLNAEHEVTDAVALMSFSSDVYVSQNNIFTTRDYRKTVYTHNEYDLMYTHTMSEIRIVPYSDGAFGDTRSVTAAGTVLNRYCLDEYNGTLRAVTTVSFSESSYSYMGENPYPNTFWARCMLYCYDLETLEVIGKVADFSPPGESVRSARFYGDTVYVCTALGFTDPVFAFDLSDLNNITYTDTGTIPGYSLSLNSFADNTLLGIGYGDRTSTLKIELYEQTENKVESVAKYEENSVAFPSEFKAHLIDAKNGIVGLGIYSYSGSARYAVFHYDGYELTEIASVKMDSTSVDYMRATVIDGYVYIFEDNGKNMTNYLKIVKVE